MSKIKLLVEIDEEEYENVKNGHLPIRVFNACVYAVENGTPLPKGHGRLIDADKTALLSDLFCYTKFTGIDEAPYEDATAALEFAPTIIEADE